MKTAVPKPATQAEQWYVIDAAGTVLGRLATEAAILLRGKHEPTFSPHLPSKNHVIVINAAAVKITGQKPDQKLYYRHSGRPGALKSRPLAEEIKRHPNRIIERAITGMLPGNRLRQVWLNHLHVYAGDSHPHLAQKPKEISVGR